MNKLPTALRVMASWLLCAAAGTALAQATSSTAGPTASPANSGYTTRGADTCLGCHDDESATYSAGALFKSRHAHRGDKRSPFGAGQLQCESCHGPGAQHARDSKASSIVSFKAGGKATLEQRNQTCLSCHEGGTRHAWQASAHDRSKVACSDCHKVHDRHGDPMKVKARETAQCLTCHTSQRADFHKTSSHPLRTGKMACSDCHSAHGSSAPAMLAKATVNQTCTSCHADKRGPLLWEHAPVTEDCSLCHKPHGSVRPALLTKSARLLCQSCHSAAGHPAVARTPQSLPGGNAGGAAFTVLGSCTNCHTQVHGSNHPGGAKLLR